MSQARANTKFTVPAATCNPANPAKPTEIYLRYGRQAAISEVLISEVLAARIQASKYFDALQYSLLKEVLL